MTVPVIDGIDMNTWEYRRVYGDADKHFRGIFEWGLLYKETELTEREKRQRKHGSEPFRLGIWSEKQLKSLDPIYCSNF